MTKPFAAFFSLYAATLLLLLGSGLLTTFLALRLAADQVDDFLISTLTTSYYIGLVVGAKVGHRLIARVGHIRAYVASAGVTAATVLCIGLIHWLPFWIGARALIGIGMMCQYMVLESWLNEQAETHQRGAVFGLYMAITYLGLMLGQLMLIFFTDLSIELLLIVAICFSLCLVPLAVTRTIHPTALKPAPLDILFFIKQIPQPLMVIFIAGMVVGSFYGLAPIYASYLGLSVKYTGFYMAACIGGGLLIQWPLGWLSDRCDRTRLIKWVAIIMFIIAIGLALPAGWVPILAVLVLGVVFTTFQFTLYPLAVAFANDHVKSDRRVSLSAIVLVTFGVGASIGPLISGALMRSFSANAMYGFLLFCVAFLALRIQPDKITNLQKAEDAPLPHAPAPEVQAASPLAAALDPRVDETQMQDEEALTIKEAIMADMEENRTQKAELENSRINQTLINLTGLTELPLATTDDNKKD